jgi:hypothetical protein
VNEKHYIGHHTKRETAVKSLNILPNISNLIVPGVARVI